MTGIMANLWASTATFQKGKAEKASFVLLSIIDLLLTVLAVYCGFTELNPFVRYLVTIPVLLLVVKLAIPYLIAWLIPGRLLLPAIALLGLVVIWNMKELFIYLV
jgi:hypothetical protein